MAQGKRKTLVKCRRRTPQEPKETPLRGKVIGATGLSKEESTARWNELIEFVLRALEEEEEERAERKKRMAEVAQSQNEEESRVVPERCVGY